MIEQLVSLKDVAVWPKKSLLILFETVSDELILYWHIRSHSRIKSVEDYEEVFEYFNTLRLFILTRMGEDA